MDWGKSTLQSDKKTFTYFIIRVKPFSNKRSEISLFDYFLQFNWYYFLLNSKFAIIFLLYYRETFLFQMSPLMTPCELFFEEIHQKLVVKPLLVPKAKPLYETGPMYKTCAYIHWHRLNQQQYSFMFMKSNTVFIISMSLQDAWHLQYHVIMAFTLYNDLFALDAGRVKSLNYNYVL